MDYSQQDLEDSLYTAPNSLNDILMLFLINFFERVKIMDFVKNLTVKPCNKIEKLKTILVKR